MQKLSEIRELLLSAGKRPQGRLGQRFLIDANLMSKLLELAELAGGETVLEVGAATGSLTEELLEHAGRRPGRGVPGIVGRGRQSFRATARTRVVIRAEGEIAPIQEAVAAEIAIAPPARLLVIAGPEREVTAIYHAVAVGITTTCSPAHRLSSTNRKPSRFVPDPPQARCPRKAGNVRDLVAVEAHSDQLRQGRKVGHTDELISPEP